MPRSKPYLPLLLRIFHNLAAGLALLAIVTSFLVYNTYDGRFGKLPLPRIRGIIDLHGTVGLFFLLILPIFSIYSFHAGEKRLVQSDSFQKLSQFGKPIWWLSLQRIVNTAMLLAATFAVITGRMMQEKWLPNGEFNHLWYTMHLTAWAVLVLCLAFHLLATAKVGGVPLFLAMFDPTFRREDSPDTWPEKIRSWLRNPHL